MEFVNKLRQHQQNKRSIRKTLLKYGTKDWTNFARPLNQLSEEEVTTLIINWIPKALSKNETVKVRLQVDQEIYEVWFKKTRGTIYVKNSKKEETENGTLVSLA